MTSTESQHTAEMSDIKWLTHHHIKRALGPTCSFGDEMDVKLNPINQSLKKHFSIQRDEGRLLCETIRADAAYR